MSATGPFRLSGSEREFVIAALLQAPGHCSDELARALGFLDANDCSLPANRYIQSLRLLKIPPIGEWRRILSIVEIMFCSEVFGSGIEWELITGISDSESLRNLRAIQSRLVAIVHR